MNVVLNASSEKRNSRQVFPTPESPINSSLNNKSYVFFAILTSSTPENKNPQFYPRHLKITTFIYNKVNNDLYADTSELQLSWNNVKTGSYYNVNTLAVINNETSNCFLTESTVCCNEVWIVRLWII